MTDGDADNDNDVDSTDLTIWQSQFGNQTPASSLAPLSTSGNHAGEIIQSAAGSQQRVTEPVPDSALSAGLVDAVLAFDTTRGNQSDELTVADSESAFSIPFFEASSPPSKAASTTISKPEPSAFSADTDTESSEPWLDDELLEAVFG